MSMHATVILINGRGDYLINLPAIRALSDIFAGELDCIAMKGARELIFPEPALSRIIEPDYTKSALGPEFDAAQLAEIIGETDIFLSLNPWHTASIDALLAHLAPKFSVGFFDAFQVVLPLDFEKNSFDLAFDLVKTIAPELVLEDYSAPPRFLPKFERFAAEIRAALPKDARIIAIHNDTVLSKIWDHEKFTEIVTWLLASDPAFYVLDLGLTSATRNALAKEGRVIGCQDLILPAAFSLVAYADLFVGVDSCFLHAADLYRIPGVGLFGATKAHEFGFRFSRHCHVSGTSMEDIDVRPVQEAISSLLDECKLRQDSIIG